MLKHIHVHISLKFIIIIIIIIIIVIITIILFSNYFTLSQNSESIPITSVLIFHRGLFEEDSYSDITIGQEYQLSNSRMVRPTKNSSKTIMDQEIGESKSEESRNIYDNEGVKDLEDDDHEYDDDDKVTEYLSEIELLNGQVDTLTSMLTTKNEESEEKDNTIAELKDQLEGMKSVTGDKSIIPAVRGVEIESWKNMTIKEFLKLAAKCKFTVGDDEMRILFTGGAAANSLKRSIYEQSIGKNKHSKIDTPSKAKKLHKPKSVLSFLVPPRDKHQESGKRSREIDYGNDDKNNDGGNTEPLKKKHK
jgi:hypothetical protein